MNYSITDCRQDAVITYKKSGCSCSTAGIISCQIPTEFNRRLPPRNKHLRYWDIGLPILLQLHQ